MDPKLINLFDTAYTFILLAVQEHGKGYTKTGKPKPEPEPWTGITQLLEDIDQSRRDDLWPDPT